MKLGNELPFLLKKMIIEKITPVDIPKDPGFISKMDDE